MKHYGGKQDGFKGIMERAGVDSMMAYLADGDETGIQYSFSVTCCLAGRGITVKYAAVHLFANL